MHLFAHSITLLIEPVNGKSVNDGIRVGGYREKAVGLRFSCSISVDVWPSQLLYSIY